MGANRIKQLRVERGWSQDDLAERVDTSNQQISKLERGKARLTQEWMERLASAFGVKPWEIVAHVNNGESGRLAPPEPDHPPLYSGQLEAGVIPIGHEEYASLARFDARFAAGAGSLLEPDPEPLGFHLVELQWLRMLTSAAPEHLAIVMVDGDSMEPTLSDRDWVLIDTTQRRLSRQGIFALRVDDSVWIKRVQPILSQGVVRLHSDNKNYDPDDVDPESLQPIGRVLAVVARKL